VQYNISLPSARVPRAMQSVYHLYTPLVPLPSAPQPVQQPIQPPTQPLGGQALGGQPLGGQALSGPQRTAVPCFIYFTEHRVGTPVTAQGSLGSNVWTHFDFSGAPVPFADHVLCQLYALSPNPVYRSSFNKHPCLRSPQSPLVVRASRSSHLPRAPRSSAPKPGPKSGPKVIAKPRAKVDARLQVNSLKLNSLSLKPNLNPNLKPVASPQCGAAVPAALALGPSASGPEGAVDAPPLPRMETYREVWRTVDPTVLPPLSPLKPVFRMRDYASSCAPSSDDESSGEEP